MLIGRSSEDLAAYNMVLPIVGLYIETISSGNFVVLWFGSTVTKYFLQN
jgi:hypothetical protein